MQSSQQWEPLDVTKEQMSFYLSGFKLEFPT